MALQELPAETELRRITDFLRDVLDGKIRMKQSNFRTLHAQADDILFRRSSHARFKPICKGARAYAEFTGDIVHGDLLRKTALENPQGV